MDTAKINNTIINHHAGATIATRITVDTMPAEANNGDIDTPQSESKMPQQGEYTFNQKSGDLNSEFDINGTSSRLSKPESPPLDEDEVMNDSTVEIDKQPASPAQWEEWPAPTPRRSTRSRKAPINYENEYIIPAMKEPARVTAASSRPKRKAAIAAQKSFTSKEDLDLVTATLCTPLVSEELRSYKGWVELESEPSFFQAMLHEMGAPDLKITELFSTDEDSITSLPHPVYGLIFLFPYEETGEHNGEERQNCPGELWFANQTNANGCATVALMNIAMNIPNSQYGPELQNFKDETRTLSYLERGQALDNNDFIRCIHNSIARRTQLLNEDLAWKNKLDEEEKKSKRTVKAHKRRGKGKAHSSATSKMSAATKNKKDYSSAAMHYIAYVPHNGKVWEFDGLEDKPLCLGSFQGTSDNWVTTAIETIQVRMAAGLYSNTFNLLAVCVTPLQSLEDQMIQSLAASQRLEQQYRDDAAGDDLQWPHPPISVLFPPEKLERLNHLTWEMTANIGPTETFLQRIAEPGFGKEQAASLMAELIVEQSDIEAQLVAEIDSHRSARLEYESRQRDFTPFIHQFLLALAETGQLEETVNNFAD